MAEFAEHGYHGASTSAIAAHAGISQPYIYALFPNKRDLFLAVQEEGRQLIRAAFADAAREAESPQAALEAMGKAYLRLLADRDELLCQLQGYAAAGDQELRAQIARGYTDLFDDVRRLSGASAEEVARFFATGMMLTIAATLELPPRCWPRPT